MSNTPLVAPLVGIVMGSDSDWPIMRAAAVALKNLGIPYEAKVLSAHRTPDQALEYAATASERGIGCLSVISPTTGCSNEAVP